MPRIIACPEEDKLTLPELIEALNDPHFDPADEDSFAAAGPLLKRLANNREFLAEIAVDQAPLSVEYDSATGVYVGCSATGDTSSRIQMISTLFRKLGRNDAFPAIAAFLDHSDFFVRWHVMKELLGIDTAAALPHLKRMAATDPHPDPRRAARTVLDRIEGAVPPARSEAA